MEFKTFSDFYAFYLSEHQDVNCRRMHFIGSWLVLAVIAGAVFTGAYIYLLLAPVVGYGFAWVGHFFFEHNKPATFRYPVRSLISDWVMFAHILRGRVSI